MPDVYTTIMQDHLAGYYQAHGLSPSGADQVAKQQAPSSAVDQAMLAAHDRGPYSPTLGKNPLEKKETPPPGLKPVHSETIVVSMD